MAERTEERPKISSDISRLLGQKQSEPLEFKGARTHLDAWRNRVAECSTSTEASSFGAWAKTARRSACKTPKRGHASLTTSLSNTSALDRCFPCRLTLIAIKILSLSMFPKAPTNRIGSNADLGPRGFVNAKAYPQSGIGNRRGECRATRPLGA